MNEDQNDVTTETTDASSAENQTEVSSESQTDQSENSQDKKVSESVPYERFAEVNSKTKALEEELRQIKESLNKKDESPTNTQETLAKQQQEALIKQQLKEMGFVSKEEIQQIESDRKLETELKSLESKYDGKDGRPKFNKIEILEFARDKGILNIEDAYKLKNHDQLMSFAVKQATGINKPVKSESSDGSGSSEAGTTNSDLINAVRKGDKSSLNSFIKRLMN